MHSLRKMRKVFYIFTRKCTISFLWVSIRLSRQLDSCSCQKSFFVWAWKRTSGAHQTCIKGKANKFSGPQFFSDSRLGTNLEKNCWEDYSSPYISFCCMHLSNDRRKKINSKAGWRKKVSSYPGFCFSSRGSYWIFWGWVNHWTFVC